MSEMSEARVEVEWVSLGTLAYDDALEIQESRKNALLDGKDELQTVFTVEHPPTITIGRNGTPEHIIVPQNELMARGFSIRQVDRGGDVTYHGPGQLVVYPILHLNPWQNNVNEYVRNLEEMVILALHEVGIIGTRLAGYPGVWVKGLKICAIGARIKRRPSGEFVTSHGIALNVATDLSHFETIVPCGISDKGVTSITRELETKVGLKDWEARIRTGFAQVFQASFHDATLTRSRG